jgi:hypothetical protein
MRPTEKRIIKRGVDQGFHKTIAIVSLPKGRSVLLYDDDLQALLDLGLSPLWHFDKQKGVVVWLKKARRWGSLARVITNAGPGTNVLLKDGNKLNCCSDNIIVTDQKRGGGSKRHDRADIDAMYGWQKHIIFR